MMSLAPVKRSHSCCAQGGINSVNDLTRQLGDSEWKHFDDTVYGGDFLQHQPPVKELAYWAPRIIDLMDRLGVTFNRTPEGFRDHRRFGGTLYQRTAFAGATTGQQLVYALDEQVRRWEVAGKVPQVRVLGLPRPDARRAGPLPRLRGPGPGHHGDPRLAGRRPDPGQRRLRGDLRPLDQLRGLQRQRGEPGLPGRRPTTANAEFIQVHPTAIPGADKLRLISESAAARAAGCGCRAQPQDPRPPGDIPEQERYYFLEERYPKYGNLVPRDIATREIFKVCIQEGLSVQADRLCVYLDVTHLPRELLDRKLAGILEIYEKFQGADPRDRPMKIFPAVHYSMGGLWVRLRGRRRGRPGDRLAAEPADQHPRHVCHRRMRLPVSTAPTAWAPIRWCPASSAV